MAGELVKWVWVGIALFFGILFVRVPPGDLYQRARTAVGGFVVTAREEGMEETLREAADELEPRIEDVDEAAPTEVTASKDEVEGAGEGVAAVDVAMEEPRRVGVGVRRPRRISGPDPRYTEAARNARIQGTVVVEAVIDRQGSVARARVIKPLHPELDRAALDAVAQWMFEPATLHGETVPVYYNLTVDFELE